MRITGYGADDQFKNPRGIRGYSLTGATDFDYWKLAGNYLGEGQSPWAAERGGFVG